MTDRSQLPHDVHAKRDAHGRGWLAIYQCPKLGVRHVRDANGKVILYESRESAERSAMRALLAALDQVEPPRSKMAQVFTVSGQGRNRRAVPA